MLDAGELPGWVQRMMGYEPLQMIKYWKNENADKKEEKVAHRENLSQLQTPFKDLRFTHFYSKYSINEKSG
jgi:hypothetical protein